MSLFSLPFFYTFIYLFVFSYYYSLLYVLNIPNFSLAIDMY